MQRDEHGSTGEDRTVSRRQVLKAAGATGAVAGSGLAGCLARGQSGPNTVQFAASKDVKDNKDKIEKELYKAGLSKDIKLDVIAGAAATGARKQQYSRWLSAGLEDPTLFMMDSGWSIPFIVSDQLANISELRPNLTKTVQNEYYETFVRAFEGSNGDLFGIPLFPTTGNMLYRKDLVKKAGFQPEKEQWATNPLTWKKFSKVTKETQKQTDTKYGFSFQANTYEGLSCCDFKEFTGTWGGSYFGARENLFGPVNGRPVTVNSDPVLKATRMVRTFIDGDDKNALDGYAGNIAPRAVLQWTEEPSRKPFSNGNVVMHRNWPYAILAGGSEESFGKDLGVMPIPYAVKEGEAKYSGYGGPTSSLGGWGITLNPNSSNKEMGLEVMKAMTDRKFQLFLFETLGWLPPRPKLFDSKRAKQVPVMGRYLDTLKMNLKNSVPRPVTVAWPQESTKIAQKANSAFAGDSAPKQAMNTLADQLEAIEEASDRRSSGQQSGGQSGGGS
jgi:ABC-type glycerol-3-phosphate transport system substrate-binding protein